MIWKHIENNVANRMLDEFGSLFPDITKSSFKNYLIETSKYTKLKDLNIFQEQIQKSQGYHQYCSQTLYQPTSQFLFFSDKQRDKDEDSEKYHVSNVANQ